MSIVVDCDSHVLEPKDLWLNYLNSRFLDRAIRVEYVDNDEHLMVNNKPLMTNTLARMGGAHQKVTDIWHGRYDDVLNPEANTTEARLKFMDSYGVSHAVTFPTILAFQMPHEEEPELTSAYCSAYNRWMYDFSKPSNGRIIPVAVINWFDVETAAKELELCITQYGCRGVFLPSDTIGGRRPGDTHFDPIWQIIAHYDIPALIHVNLRFDTFTALLPWQASRPRVGPLFGFSLNAYAQIIPTLGSLIYDHICERYPSIKLVAVELGCGFAAHMMDRMDDRAHTFRDMKPMKRKPSEYIRDNCYFVADPEERTIGDMLYYVGEKNIVWGSDYPHCDSNLDAPSMIRESVIGLYADQREAVLGKNARELFNLPK